MICEKKVFTEKISKEWFSKHRNKLAHCPNCGYANTQYFYDKLSERLDEEGGVELGFYDSISITCPKCKASLLAVLELFEQMYDFDMDPIPDTKVNSRDCYASYARWKLRKLVTRDDNIWVDIHEFGRHKNIPGRFSLGYYRPSIETRFDKSIYRVDGTVRGYNLGSPLNLDKNGVNIHADNYIKHYPIEENQRLFYKRTYNYRTDMSILMTLVYNGFTVFQVHSEGMYYVMENEKTMGMFGESYLKAIPDNFRLSEYYSDLGISWDEYIKNLQKELLYV